MGSVRIATSAAFVALAASAVVLAAPPGVSITVNVDGNDSVFNPGGTSTAAPGVYNYLGGETNLSWLTTWDFNASNSQETAMVFVSGNFTFQNLSAFTQVYDVLIELSTTPDASPTKMGGSVAGGLTADFDGGEIGALDNDFPIWSAYVDGSQQAGLLVGGLAVAGAFDSATLGYEDFGGYPIPNLDGPALGSKMAVRLRFYLTAGDQASFTSVFVMKVIPTPAGIALFGFAAIAGRRRRA